MKYKIKLIKKLLPYFIIVIMTVILFGQCSERNFYLNKSQKYELKLSETSNSYEKKINKLKENVVLVESLNTKMNTKLAKLIDTLEYVKNLKSSVSYKVKTEYLTDTIKIEIPTVNIDSNEYLKLPFIFLQEEQWFKYGFTIKEGKVIRDFLSFNDEFIVAQGEKDNGFIKNLFKKSVTTIYISSKNPYSYISEPKSVVITDNKKKWGFTIGVTYSATQNGLQPGVGVTFGRRVF